MLNIAIMQGRLVQTPELRHTPAGAAVTSFTLAVDRQYCEPGRERQADFIDFEAWRNTAEFICKYFVKGQMMAVKGHLKTSTYTDQNDTRRKKMEVVAEEVNFCGDKPKRNEPQEPQAPEYIPPYSNGGFDGFTPEDSYEDLASLFAQKRRGK